MTINLFQTSQYRELMQSHIFSTIEYLFDKEQNFAVACEVKYLDFNPELPRDIKEGFNDTILFVLSGYTLESAKLDADYFSFEAGFGSDNVGSVVTIPLLSIQQIFVGDNPIVMNHSKPIEKSVGKIEKESKKTQESTSMEALLKNPENQKLLKVKK